VNVPAVENVCVKVRPGAIEPEFHEPPVDVCVVLSLLVQVTLPPTATVTGLGEYAVVVMLDAPPTIDTGVPLPPPDGGFDGLDGVEYEDPQPEHMIRSAAASARRRAMRPPACLPGNSLAFRARANYATFFEEARARRSCRVTQFQSEFQPT